jgi:hypothetical protein
MRRFPRPMSLICLAFLLATCVAFAGEPVFAQDAVTATSGSPAAIARVRAEYAAIQREAPRYRQTEHDLYGFSLEGGELHGFYRGSELRKLSARHFGETGQGTQEYYFADGRLIFIHVVVHRYARPFGEGGVQWKSEHRLYFDRGRLIRRIRTRDPSARVDLSVDDPEVADLLETARLFAACAAAPDGAVRECTAPPR